MPIKFAGKLNSFSRGPRGFFVKLEIGGDDDWQELAAAPLGTSFGVVMVAIDPETGRVPEASPGGAQASALTSTGQQRDEAGKSRKPFHELSRAQQAGILCGDDVFQCWFAGIRKITGKFDCAEAIRNHFGVQSRAELDFPTVAGDWDRLVAAFRMQTGQMAEQR